MMTKMKLGLIVMTVLLLASACGTSSPEVAAIANSSAQQAGATTTTPSPEPTSEPEADLTTTERSQFCAAIEDFVDLPFKFSGEEDMSSFSESERAATIDAIQSFREVAAVVPGDAPNIVAFFFSSIPDTAEALLLRSGEQRQNDATFLSTVVLAVSIEPGDIVAYTETTCGLSDFEINVADASFPVPDYPLVPPSPGELCPALDELRLGLAQLETTTDEVEATTEQIEQIEQLTVSALRAVSALESDAPHSAAAFLRLYAGLLGGGESGMLGAFVIDSLDGSRAATYLRSTCPDLEDPSDWLITGDLEPTFVAEASTLVVESAVGTSTSELTAFLSSSLGTLEAGPILITVGQTTFTRKHIPNTARDTDEMYVELELSFDRGHNFELNDFALEAPDGLDFSPDPNQMLAPDAVRLRITVDREVGSGEGWTFLVRHDDGIASLDL